MDHPASQDPPKEEGASRPTPTTVSSLSSAGGGKQTINDFANTVVLPVESSVISSTTTSSSNLVGSNSTTTNRPRKYSEGELPPKPKHGRNVSWSMTAAAAATGPVPATTTSSSNSHLELSPDLSSLGDDLGEHLEDSLGMPHLNNDDEVHTSNIPSQKSNNTPAKKKTVSVSMREVLKANPLENEAESYILEALEAQDPVGGRTRLDTGTSTLFSQVPKETQDILIEMDIVKTHHHQNTEHYSSQQEPDENNSDNKMRATGADDDSLDKPNSLRRRKTSNTTAGTGPTKGKSRPDLARNASRATQAHSVRTKSSDRSAPKPKKAPPPLSEAETAEQHLAGLASQLNRLHKKAEVQMNPTELPMPIRLDMDLGVAEHFAAAASILMHRKRKDKDEHPTVPSGDHVSPPSSPSRSPARKRWDIIKDAVDHPTTLDDEPTEAVPGMNSIDVEQGVDAVGEPLGTIVENPSDAPAGGAKPPESVSSASDFEEEEPGGYGTKLRNKLRDKFSFFREFEDFLSPRKNQIGLAFRTLMFIVIPLLGLAFILFYAAGNPPTGKIDLGMSKNGTLINTEGKEVDPTTASASWWVLYIVRHLFLFVLSKGFEVFVIEFLCLGTGWFPTVAGSFFTLFVIQSRGWPFLMTCWGVLSWILLGGQYGFSAHWLYSQSFLDIFNAVNPSGNITTSVWNTRVHAIAVSVGIIVAMKRIYIGVSQSRKTFATYAGELGSVVKKILLITEVASAARDYEWRYHQARTSRSYAQSAAMNRDAFESLMEDFNHEGSVRQRGNSEGSVRSFEKNPVDYQRGKEVLFDTRDVDPLTGSLKLSQKAKIAELLGAWEDPEKENREITSNISIGAILQFRQSVAFMENPFLFSLSFGLADTRVNCIESAQELYQRLFLRTPNADFLHFEVMAFCALRSDGSLDQEKLRELIRIFRPDRDGNLSMLDFVKSIDSVFKEVKFLRASIKSSQKVDQALEKIFNIGFYALMVTIILAQVGLDPLAIFLSLSSLIVGFAFMIGNAASQYFLGVLLIMFRKPFDIGDRINVSAVDTDTPASGSPGWIVKNITLHTTTLMFATTGEVCTVSNGSLATTRIINAARSPRAQLYVYTKFGVETPFEKIQLFEEAARKFVKARPREWLSFIAFRATRVEADLGYVEYVTVLQHRDRWQNIGAVLQSKADISSFYLEVSKKLDMRYQSPPLPVDLSIITKKNEDPSQQSKGSDDLFLKGSDAGSTDGAHIDMAKLAAFFTS